MDGASKFFLTLCIAEFLVIIALHVLHNWHVHKLLNKLMSRDYRDYHSTVVPPQPVKREPLPQDIPEDLRVLQGFQIP
jgi:hypothetical protein